MKTLATNSPPGLRGKMLAAMALLAVLAFTGPFAHAATSGKATVYNSATVTYDSGAATGLTATDSEVVTVATLAAAPTVTTSSSGLTVLGGADAVYTLTITSNANGIDTYTGSVNSQVNTGVSAPTDAFTGPLSLWGGIIVQNTTVLNRFEVPGGSIGADLSNGDTLIIGGNAYTVSSVTAGNAQTTTPSDETYDQVVVAPVGAAPDLAIGTAAGTQVGQQNTMTFTQTAGTPSTPGTDGTHAQNARVTTTATLADNATNATTDTAITTTVSSPAVTISKGVRNVTKGEVAFNTSGTTTAKPGDTLEYQIVLTNTSSTGDATAVYVTDTLPAYVTLNTGDAATYGGASNDIQATYSVGSVVTTATASNADTDTAALTGSSLVVTAGSGAGDATAGTPVGGTIAAGSPNETVTILFQVTVN